MGNLLLWLPPSFCVLPCGISYIAAKLVPITRDCRIGGIYEEGYEVEDLYCSSPRWRSAQGRRSARISLVHWIILHAPNECVSRPKHALDSGIHLFFLDEFASCHLVDANLDPLLEPLAMGKELRNGLLHQFIGSTSGLDGELVKPRGLILK